MGIYDRDYYRPGQPGFTLRGPSTVVGWLLAINVAAFLANGLLTPGNSEHPNLIAGVMALYVDTLTHPLFWWQFLTYGFDHAPWPAWQHIAGNMLGLWVLGRGIEELYGRREFLRLYLAMIVVAGLVQCLYMKLTGDGGLVLGASGAIAGIVVLYAVHFPRRTLLLFFIIPVPAWVAGVLLIVLDSFGALNPNIDQVGHAAHLGGAAFAFVYYRLGWRITPSTDRLFSLFSLAWLKRRPKLRVHRPDQDRDDQESQDDRDDAGDEVDRILAKIHREGVESLTTKERRALEAASQRYQHRRKE